MNMHSGLSEEKITRGERPREQRFAEEKIRPLSFFLLRTAVLFSSFLCGYFPSAALEDAHEG